MESRQQGGTKPKKSLEGWPLPTNWCRKSDESVPHKNKPPPPVPARTRPSVFNRKRPVGNGTTTRKEPIAGLFLRRWCDCRQRAVGLLQGSPRGGGCGSPFFRCLRCYHDSGVAGGSGGGRLDCRLPDRLGAEGEGEGLTAKARGTQGQGSRPEAISLLLHRAFRTGSRAAGAHVRPSAWCAGPWSNFGRPREGCGGLCRSGSRIAGRFTLRGLRVWPGRPR